MQLMGDLLGAPPLAEQLVDNGAELDIEEQPSLAWTSNSLLSEPIRGLGR
ncbi:hypothetical protein JCM18899A_52410 [Nocardioides sp. AN3]